MHNKKMDKAMHASFGMTIKDFRVSLAWRCPCDGKTSLKTSVVAIPQVGMTPNLEVEGQGILVWQMKRSSDLKPGFFLTVPA